jgi:acetyltransferase-like isoleucine patch superfamily enzyme
MPHKMKTTFYEAEELAELGFKRRGRNVLISRKASIYSPESVSLGDNVRIDDFCLVSGELTIGSHVHIGAYSALFGSFGIEMGDCTGLSPRCTIFSATDDFGGNYLISPTVPAQYTRVTGGRVILKRFSQIGAGTTIFPHVTIEEGVAVGAMSLVRSDLIAWGIYAGNPLRFIRSRERGLLDLYARMTNAQ